MKHFCVIGCPITHSRSPALHRAGFVELEIDADFQAVEIKPDELEHFVREEFPKTYAGAAVTVPHKEAVRKYVDAETDIAKAVGAINTLAMQDGKIIGTNTDVVGALHALRTGCEVLGKSALVLGAGGASRAIVYGLGKAGVRVAIWNRTLEKAETLAHEFQTEIVPSLDSIHPERFDIIINTTSVGLRAWESVFPADMWRANHVAFDMVYDPLETKFLSDAASAGAVTVTGDLMLVHQALEQFRIWHNITLEPEVMMRSFFTEEGG